MPKLFILQVNKQARNGGHVNEVNGVRKVVSTEAEYDSHNQHGLKFVKARD